MKKTLILAMSAALLASTAAMAAQDDNADMQTTKTTTTTVQHVNGQNATWYREGGVVPTEYRTKTYEVHSWKTEHLNEPTMGSHWVRGDDGDFLLVDDNSGAITHIVHQH